MADSKPISARQTPIKCANDRAWCWPTFLQTQLVGDAFFFKWEFNPSEETAARYTYYLLLNLAMNALKLTVYWILLKLFGRVCFRLCMIFLDSDTLTWFTTFWVFHCMINLFWKIFFISIGVSNLGHLVLLCYNISNLQYYSVLKVYILKPNRLFY